MVEVGRYTSVGYVSIGWWLLVGYTSVGQITIEWWRLGSIPLLDMFPLGGGDGGGGYLVALCLVLA